MSEVLLHIAFVDLSRGGESGAQRMAGEHHPAFAFRQIATHACRQRGSLDETRDLLVVKPLRSHGLALTGHPAEQRAMDDPRELEPGLERDDGAGRIGGAASDLDFAPAGLAAQCQQHAFVQNFHPAGRILGLVAATVEASYDAETQQGAVFVVNRSLTDTITTELVWQDGQEVSLDQAWQLSGSDPKEANSWEEPNRLVANAIPVPQMENGRSTLSLPPLSFTVLTTRTA